MTPGHIDTLSLSESQFITDTSFKRMASASGGVCLWGLPVSSVDRKCMSGSKTRCLHEQRTVHCLCLRGQRTCGVH